MNTSLRYVLCHIMNCLPPSMSMTAGEGWVAHGRGVFIRALPWGQNMCAGSSRPGRLARRVVMQCALTDKTWADCIATHAQGVPSIVK